LINNITLQTRIVFFRLTKPCLIRPLTATVMGSW